MGQQEGRLRIMPMGDSITHGFQVPGGYRQPLHDLLSRAGYDVDFVGRYSQAGDPGMDRDHWGRPGLGIADTAAILGGRSYVSLQANEGPDGAVRDGLYDDLNAAIASPYFSNDPDDTNILLLLVGTNDVVHQVVQERDGARPAGDRNNDGRGEQQDRIAEASFERLQAFLERVNELARTQKLLLAVVVGTIPDISDSWNSNGLKDPISEVMRQELRQYNRMIQEGLGQNRYSNLALEVVDTFAAVGNALADGLHPSAEGHRRMAQSWADGIEKVLASRLENPEEASSPPGASEPVPPREVGRNYVLQVKDYDGNPHGLRNCDGQASIASAYRYQGEADVNGDGRSEAIFTNRASGRWATVGIDPITGTIDFADHGAGGITRVVGIYIDPLIIEGESNGGFLLNGEAAPARFGPFDSQARFQQDLEIDNLTLRASGDFNDDGMQELYWKVNDGTAYLRTLMHADGNIQYGNYQNEAQMRDYLAASGHGGLIQTIL
jgi:lysophospholipase L1-like esterase